MKRESGLLLLLLCKAILQVSWYQQIESVNVNKST